MLASLILYIKGMRMLMFQLSGFYCRGFRVSGLGFGASTLCPARCPSSTPRKSSHTSSWHISRGSLKFFRLLDIFVAYFYGFFEITA